MSLEKELRDGADAVADAKAGRWVYYAAVGGVCFLLGVAFGAILF